MYNAYLYGYAFYERVHIYGNGVFLILLLIKMLDMHRELLKVKAC